MLEKVAKKLSDFNKLNEFVESIKPDIDYFDKYGDPIGSLANYSILERISTEFKKLEQGMENK